MGQSSRQACCREQRGRVFSCSVSGTKCFAPGSFHSFASVVIDISVSALLQLLGRAFQRRTLFPLNLKV